MIVQHGKALAWLTYEYKDLSCKATAGFGMSRFALVQMRTGVCPSFVTAIHVVTKGIPSFTVVVATD